MSVYTKTGDKGETSLYDGTRIPKNSLRVEVYGTIDEVNTQISFAQKAVLNNKTKKILNMIQHKLFILAGEIATFDQEKRSRKSSSIKDKDINELEQIIDDYSKNLEAVQSFVLPGKIESSSRLHVARTVTRRAERLIVELSNHEDVREVLIKYLNRLSDVMYIFARDEDENMAIELVIEEIAEKYLQAVNEETVSIDQKNLTNIINRAIHKAEEFEVPVTISIVDPSGNLVALYRMPGAILASVELSQKKAYTAIAMGMSTINLKESSQPGNDLYQIETNTNGKIVTFAGGIPINKSEIGAIGISGGSVQEDQTIAEYAIEEELN
jgi:ATP:cob(I)alamin adenosyltransferase